MRNVDDETIRKRMGIDKAAWDRHANPEPPKPFPVALSVWSAEGYGTPECIDVVLCGRSQEGMRPKSNPQAIRDAAVTIRAAYICKRNNDRLPGVLRRLA